MELDLHFGISLQGAVPD